MLRCRTGGGRAEPQAARAPGHVSTSKPHHGIAPEEGSVFCEGGRAVWSSKAGGLLQQRGGVGLPRCGNGSPKLRHTGRFDYLSSRGFLVKPNEGIFGALIQEL